MAITGLIEEIEQAFKEGKMLYVLFVDFTKAFSIKYAENNCWKS
jgi:hypothetical protein